MEIIGLVGLVFAAAALGALVYEHQTDVLHGPYIEGRVQPRTLDLIWDPLRPLADQLSFKARNVVYLALLA
jgi:hypothetical protein